MTADEWISKAKELEKELEEELNDISVIKKLKVDDETIKGKVAAPDTNTVTIIRSYDGYSLHTIDCNCEEAKAGKVCRHEVAFLRTLAKFEEICSEILLDFESTLVKKIEKEGLSESLLNLNNESFNSNSKEKQEMSFKEYFENFSKRRLEAEEISDEIYEKQLEAIIIFNQVISDCYEAFKTNPDVKDWMDALDYFHDVTDYKYARANLFALIDEIDERLLSKGYLIDGLELLADIIDSISWEDVDIPMEGLEKTLTKLKGRGLGALIMAYERADEYFQDEFDEHLRDILIKNDFYLKEDSLHKDSFYELDGPKSWSLYVAEKFNPFRKD